MDIDKVVAEYSGTRQTTYRLFAAKVQDLLTSLLKAAGIQPHSITSREKSASSFREKIQREGKSYVYPFKDMTDLAGVRAITFFPTDVDKVVPIIEREFKVFPAHSIDKRQTADPSMFGYASVHLVVGLSEDRLRLAEYGVFKELMCEVQVRTILQHAWAEIEHDIVYKSNQDIPFELRRRFASLAGLLEVADREFEFLRQDEARVRDHIQSTIQSENIQLPVDLESLSFYLQKYQGEEGIQPDRVSRLVHLLSEQKVESVEAFHQMLSKEALAEADSRLRQLDDFPCVPSDGLPNGKQKAQRRCLLRYALVVAKRFQIDQRQLADRMRCPALDAKLAEWIYPKLHVK